MVGDSSDAEGQWISGGAGTLFRFLKDKMMDIERQNRLPEQIFGGNVCPVFGKSHFEGEYSYHPKTREHSFIFGDSNSC